MRFPRWEVTKSPRISSEMMTSSLRELSTRAHNLGELREGVTSGDTRQAHLGLIQSKQSRGKKQLEKYKLGISDLS